MIISRQINPCRLISQSPAVADLHYTSLCSLLLHHLSQLRYELSLLVSDVEWRAVVLAYTVHTMSSLWHLLYKLKTIFHRLLFTYLSILCNFSVGFFFLGWLLHVLQIHNEHHTGLHDCMYVMYATITLAVLLQQGVRSHSNSLVTAMILDHSITSYP